MIKKILVYTSLSLMVVLLSAGSVLGAYNPRGGQNILINNSGTTPISVNLRMAELLNTGAQTFSVSVFGHNYTVDVSRAAFQNANSAPVTAQFFAAGQVVDIIGTLSATDSSLIHASVIRSSAATGVSVTPLPPSQGPASATTTTPTAPTTPTPPGTGGSGPTLDAITDAMYEHAKFPDRNIETPAVLFHAWKQPNLSTWNYTGGSQNIPMIAEAARGNYQFFADLARLERQEGLYGREFGSPGFYFSFPFAAKMIGLRDARRAGDTVAAAEIAGSLQATLALWSLVAVETPRTSEMLKEAGNILLGPGNSSRYRGLSVAVAGERWHAGAIGPADTDIILSWALDVNRSIAGNGGSRLRRTSNNLKWWNNSIAEVAGVDSYSQTTDPSIWGLTAESRSRLQSIVRGETTHLSWAISLLRDYGVWRHSPVRLRRTAQGVETVFFRAQNGNKPAQAVTSVARNGAWTGVKPCVGNVHSNEGYAVSIAGGIITATGDAPRCTSVSVPELGGNIVYEVMISGRNVTLGNNQAVPTGGGQPSAPDGTSVPDPGDNEGDTGGGGGGGRGPLDVDRV